MNEKEIKVLIREAVELDRELAIKKKRLDELKTSLKDEAARRKGEQVETGNGGRSWRYEGEDGSICNVVFAAPLLESVVKGEAFEPLKALAGAVWKKLFTFETSYKLIPNFRAAAAGFLGTDKAGKLVALCERPAGVRVSFETKRLAEPPALDSVPVKAVAKRKAAGRKRKAA